jgi:hypothetical protein
MRQQTDVREHFSLRQYGNGEIVAFDLTDKDVDDASHVPTLLARVYQLNSIFAIFRVSDHDKALVLKSRCL